MMNSIAINPSSSSSSFSFFNHSLFCLENNPFRRGISYVSLSIFRRKPRKRLVCVAQNGFNNFNLSLPINPLSLLSPILRSIRNFRAKHRWGAYLQDPSIVDDDKAPILRNGGLGMALLTVKSSAKNQFSPLIATLATNPTFMSGLFACLLAQSLKIMLNFIVEKKWDLKVVFASGGMPSSHSALCTALTTSVALCHGISDSLFPVCLGFSLIVMYDAIGVRRHAGMQAQVLNKIIEDLFQGHPISERKLKELLGHTPLQVFVGALLGIAVAYFCCQGFLVPI